MPDYTDYINDYISGELSPKEQEQFEARLETDQELHAEYLLMTEMKEYIKARSMLEEIENDPDLPLAEAQVEACFSENNSIPIDRNNRIRKTMIRAVLEAVLIGAFLVIRSL